MNLDMFQIIWNLSLQSEPGNKPSGYFDSFKQGAFVLGQSAQQFKIQSHFGIFDTKIGQGQFSDDTASQTRKCMC